MLATHNILLRVLEYRGFWAGDGGVCLLVVKLQLLKSIDNTKMSAFIFFLIIIALNQLCYSIGTSGRGFYRQPTTLNLQGLLQYTGCVIQKSCLTDYRHCSLEYTVNPIRMYEMSHWLGSQISSPVLSLSPWHKIKAGPTLTDLSPTPLT